MDKTINTLKEGALLAGGAIGGAYFLDPNTFWAKDLAADPTFVNKFQYQHWGGIIAVGAAWGSTEVSNPYLKGALVGLMIYGLLIEARSDFGWSNVPAPGTPNWGMMGTKNVDTAALDAKLKELARNSRTAGRANVAIGRENVPIGMQITRGYTGVGGGPITHGYNAVGRYKRRNNSAR